MAKALLALNLGSPNSPKTGDVRRYLREFLMDSRVIDIPWFFRTLLVKGIIAPFRAPRSAKAYQSIWTDLGSPLIVLSENLVGAIAKKLPFPVYLGMRYGEPSIRSVVEKIASDGIKEIIVWPMYPHYAMSSYETAAELASKEIRRIGLSIKKLIPSFYDHNFYISSLADQVIQWKKTAPGHHLVFSYHGLPKRHLRKTKLNTTNCFIENCCNFVNPLGDKLCYHHQVFETARLVAKQASINDYSIAYQSRLGLGWLEPFLPDHLNSLIQKGKTRIGIIAPSFLIDCLETLEELKIATRKDFLKSGGQEFSYIPALNSSPMWIDLLVNYLSEE